MGAPAAGRDIFVDNAGGDDRSSGQQAKNVARDGPVRTIAKALRLAGGGDRIVLAATGQPYRESVGIAGAAQRTAQQPLIIVGNGAVLDGSAPVPAEQWKHVGGGMYRFHPPHMGFQQLFLDDRPAARGAGRATAGRPPKLEPRQWCIFQGDIFFRVEKGKTAGRLRLTYCRAADRHHALPGRLRDHLRPDRAAFRVDGVNAFNRARNVCLSAVACRDNGRYGVDVGGASLVDIDSCLSSGNGAAGLLTSASPRRTSARAACRATRRRAGSIRADALDRKEPRRGRAGIRRARRRPPPAAGKDAAVDQPSRAPSP